MKSYYDRTAKLVREFLMYERYLLTFWTLQLHINPGECPDLWGENCNGHRKNKFNKIEKKKKKNFCMLNKLSMKFQLLLKNKKIKK